MIRRPKKSGEMRIGLPISVTDRSLAPTSPQILKSLSGERFGAICVPSFWFCTNSTISPAFFIAVFNWMYGKERSGTVARIRINQRIRERLGILRVARLAKRQRQCPRGLGKAKCHPSSGVRSLRARSFPIERKRVGKRGPVSLPQRSE